ncbi:hypothetical protein SYNPS1DRAFT_27773 [Syncephalis pseudoplumigaleata]|uniref:Tom37 C-terminal domain-containing protein n=1 Tax=Syncephalis pseudoplumigaleata TaxID=1712513 RepID=A0A4P9Z2D1_9FUNG|nr:hypothetical protein SYNPS1DRAFT_27773 [Syncephalis pseudoplumigaleata]|eukprot:RKP26546.1 hypothetical protein SYNPS1DRAFT_27773 [Syncephalis pseudoplumigaleata]
MSRSPASLTLYSWAGRWGLPTVDPFCLGVLAYLSLSEAEWSTYNANDPTLSPSGELPLLKVGEHQLVAGSEDIIRQLQTMGYDLDAALTKEEQAEAIAYRTMVEHVLYEAQLYEWFMVEDNFVEVVRPMYSRMSPIYTRYIVPIRMRNAAKERLAQAEYNKYKTSKEGGSSSSSEVDAADKKAAPSEATKLPPQMIARVRDCYNALLAKLGDQMYMFGEKPSSLDAVVYGHLALHLYADEFRHATLRSILSADEYRRLEAYCYNIRAVSELTMPTPLATCPPLPSTLSGILALPGRVLFGGDGWRAIREYWSSWRGRETATDAKRTGQADVMSPEERGFNRRRWLSILGGIGLMVGYVLWHGLVRIEFASDDEDDAAAASMLEGDEDEAVEAVAEEYPALTSEDLLKSVF